VIKRGTTAAPSATNHCRRSIVAQPLCQRVRQQLRLHIGDDLQASGPDLMAHRPRVGRMGRRGPDHITRRPRDRAAEASAKFDTSELATGMTAAFTHDSISHNAASASRLASSSVALSLRASCLLLDSTISHPHCWRDRSVTAGVRRCSSATSTRGRESLPTGPRLGHRRCSQRRFAHTNPPRIQDACAAFPAHRCGTCPGLLAHCTGQLGAVRRPSPATRASLNMARLPFAL
jgi:hypothetical protein